MWRGIAVLLIVAPLGRALEPANEFDRIVFAKLAESGIGPSEVCTDEAFLRRVYLDMTGLLPAPEETRAFLADKRPDKRAKLIEKLFAREEFVDYWSLKWGDLLRLKAEYPVRVWPKGVQTYYRWLRESIASNKPYDQFVRELLVSSGSNFREGPSNYYRAVTTRDPQNHAETTALVFMGMRMGCARCHKHPTESWTLDDDLGMAAFFAKVKFKGTGEWKEEIVYIDPDAVLKHPKSKEIVKPKLPGGPVVDVPAGEDPRIAFADWLTRPDNPYFAKNVVNRITYWLMGTGIVNEPDDLRPSNPPSNAKLLDYLAKELVAHKFDQRHIYRLILNSKTYQLASKPNGSNEKDERLFSHRRVQRLGAEQLLDAISQLTESPETYTSTIPEPYTRISNLRAVQLSDGSIGNAFLEKFGRPTRDTPYEGERSCAASVGQAMTLLNSREIETKIASGNRIKRLMQENKTDAQIVEEFYLAALCRFPTEAEKQTILAYVSKDKKQRAALLGDVMWALINTREFLFNH